jgi:glutathione S-transferase
MTQLTLHSAVASRSFSPRWLLEELEIPYVVHTLDLRKGDQKSAEYLRINAMGKVPALTDGDVTVSESPAICIYLADRYSLGVLAPSLDDPHRGSYLRWMIFSTAVFEPAIYLGDDGDPVAASGRGWGTRARVLETLDGALAAGPWLLGERFSAADVMLGSLVAIALFNRRIDSPPVSLSNYVGRLEKRPAFARAAAQTWPAAVDRQ